MESSRDQSLILTSPAQPLTPAAEVDKGSHHLSSVVYSPTDGSIPALLSPPKHTHHPNHLQRVTLRCKASTKRKVNASG